MSSKKDSKVLRYLKYLVFWYARKDILPSLYADSTAFKKSILERKTYGDAPFFLLFLVLLFDLHYFQINMYILVPLYDF